MSTCPTCGTKYPATARLCPTDGTVLEADASESRDPQLGNVLDGKYRLDALLGQGGMGSLYRATHVMLDKPVAVKLIKPELVTSPETVRRFQREARAATNLNHPNIVSVYDLGQTQDGTLYIAMELIDGPSLNEVIRRGGPMETSRAVDILRQVGSALSLAHRNQIIHRDLKPHNIMLTKGADGRELAKLLDFGIAKTFSEAATQLTMTGLVIGTPQYMAPEQAAGKPVDARSDLYSLGVILYEMLVGEVPFTADSTPVVLMKHMTEAPASPSRRFPNLAISPELERMAMRCLEKDPDNRFQTAEEFATALDAVGIASNAAAATVVSRPSAFDPADDKLRPPRASRGAKADIADAATIPMKRSGQSTPPGAARQVAERRPESAPSVTPARPADSRSPSAAVPARAASSPLANQSVPPAGVAAGSSPVVSQAAPRSKAPLAIGILAVLLLLALGIAYRQGFLSRATPESQEASVAAVEGERREAGGESKKKESESAPPTETPQPRAALSAPSAPAHESASTAAPSASRVTPSAAVSVPARGVDSRGGGAPTPRATPGATSSQAASTSSPSATGAVSTPSPAIVAASPQEATRALAPVPENPPVFLQCTGAQEICAAVRTSIEQAFQKAGMPSVRNPERAEVIMKATVTALEERVDRQFGTTFAVRTYSIDVDAEAARSSEAVPMPPPRTFSFDSQFGRERLEENTRVLAGDVVDQLRAFWKKRVK